MSSVLSLRGGTVEVAGVTDRGTVREENQDVWRLVAGTDGSEQFTLILADGMGGHAGGLESAQAAVGEAVAAIRASAAPASALPDFVSAASRGVAGVRQAIGGGPGTTLVLAVISTHEARIAHVGDSRAYLIRSGRARLLTADHTWAAEEVAAGRMSEAEARHHPRRNMITRAVLGDPVAPDVVGVALHEGDVIVLCSDGLWEPLDDATIAKLFSESEPPATLVERACDAALAAGSRDNVTLVAARVLVVGDR